MLQNSPWQMGAERGQSASLLHPHRFPLLELHTPLQQSLPIVHGAW